MGRRLRSAETRLNNAREREIEAWRNVPEAERPPGFDTLPDNVLSRIAELSVTDQTASQSFGAVCKSWSRDAPQLSQGYFHHGTLAGNKVLVESKVFAWESNDPIIICNGIFPQLSPSGNLLVFIDRVLQPRSIIWHELEGGEETTLNLRDVHNMDLGRLLKVSDVPGVAVINISHVVNNIERVCIVHPGGLWQILYPHVVKEIGQDFALIVSRPLHGVDQYSMHRLDGTLLYNVDIQNPTPETLRIIPCSGGQSIMMLVFDEDVDVDVTRIMLTPAAPIVIHIRISRWERVDGTRLWMTEWDDMVATADGRLIAFRFLENVIVMRDLRIVARYSTTGFTMNGLSFHNDKLYISTHHNNVVSLPLDAFLLGRNLPVLYD